MPESVAFEADYFEYLPASSGLALIRVAGRWVADEERPISNVQLLVEGAGTTSSSAPLPGGDSPSAVAGPDGTPWRGAFSVPLDLVSDPATRYALDAGPGTLIQLPRLVRKELEDRGGERTETPSEPHAIDLEHAELERRIGQAGDALAEARAEAERNRTRRAAMEEELRVRFESESAARETLLRSEIERAHKEAEHERTARIEVEERIEAERAELQERIEALIESERTVREELEQERGGVAAVREELEQERGGIAPVRDELTSLQHRLEEVLDSERDTRSALDQRHEELVAARAEAARLATQLAESERQIGEVRKGIEQELRARLESEQLVERLRGEVERRTQELEGARKEAQQSRKEVRPRAARQMAELRSSLQEAESALAEERNQREQLAKRLAQVEAERERTVTGLQKEYESELGGLRGDLKAARAETEREVNARIEAEQLAAQLRDDVQRRQAEVAEIEHEISQARERAEQELQSGIESEREASATLAREEAAAGGRETAERDLAEQPQRSEEPKAAGTEVEAEADADTAQKELDRTVKAQLGWTDRLLVREPLKVLPGQLAPDERPALLATGSFNRTSCLVVATDRRLLVISEQKELREEFRYDSLRAIRVAKRRFKRPRLELESAHTQVVVEEVTDNVEEIRAHVAERIPADQLLPLGGSEES